MKKKRLLIAGGGYADIPLIGGARKLGFYVITSGNRPDDLGHGHADECHLADYSDPEAVLALAERLQVDAICPCSNDFSALSCAYAAERLGLPGHNSYETTKTLHHKDLYREFAASHNIPTPRAQAFTDLDSALLAVSRRGLPVIVKPVDLTGGKGISKVTSADQARSALERAFARSRAKRVVVEEFVEGGRHGFSAFLRDGAVVFFFSDNEHYYLNPYMVSAASTPSTVGPGVEKDLCSQTERIASLLALRTGIFHIQYILRGAQPVIIEVCCRSPGDLYTRFVEHATGVEYAYWIVRASAGLGCEGLSHAEPKGFFTRHCIMSAREGRVRDVVFHEAIKRNVVDVFSWWKKGDPIEDVLTSKLGIVFLRFDGMAEMLEKTERMHELIRVSTY